MSLFRNKYRIESNRWQFWDYSSPASYFITICVKDRKEIFGQIQNKKMVFSDEGNIVADQFMEIQSYHKRIVLDEWVVMPNHIHCIITLGGYDFDNTVDKIHEFYLYPNPKHQRPYLEQPTIDEIKQYRKKRRKMLIPKILGKFQMQTSNTLTF